jgi:hypothetical protein
MMPLVVFYLTRCRGYKTEKLHLRILSFLKIGKETRQEFQKSLFLVQRYLVQQINYCVTSIIIISSSVVRVVSVVVVVELLTNCLMLLSRRTNEYRIELNLLHYY